MAPMVDCRTPLLSVSQCQARRKWQRQDPVDPERPTSIPNAPPQDGRATKVALGFDKAGFASATRPLKRFQRTFANRQRCLGMRFLVKPKKRLWRLRAQIKKIPPYPALVILAVPLAVAEPLKLATVFIAGAGHWIFGLLAMLFAYAVSLFVTHWLFVLVKPQLLTLPWFARAWTMFVALRNKFWRWLVKARPAARPLRKH